MSIIIWARNRGDGYKGLICDVLRRQTFKSQESLRDSTSMRMSPKHSVHILPLANCQSHFEQFCTAMPYFTPRSWHQWARGLQSQPRASLYNKHYGMSPLALIENKCFSCWLRLTEITLHLCQKCGQAQTQFLPPFFLVFLVPLWLQLWSNNPTLHQ